MRPLSLASALAAVAVVAAGCSAAPSPRAPAAATEPPDIYPPPTSPLFSPTPFTIPRDDVSFWAALEDLSGRLKPGKPGDVAAERRRLQACDHVAQLAEAVVLNGNERYRIGNFSGDLMGIAYSCPNQPELTYIRTKRVVAGNPFRARG